ncbi:unnamed protein product [Candidula unifasciata]|uniref:Uncharacterized protein n=1 Tax=Candidula unifasciata TaxID=100452 RepID=A0A8S3YGM5_9EUPU|nr:unnamed protein product [Candidula unifasciata]
MGGIFSQEISTEDEVTTIRDSLGLTPSQRLDNPRLHDVRLLAWDPRSPSDFISRTPIIVEKTPVIQAKRMKPSCSATSALQEGPAIKDPRSPTNEFARTPINPCQSSSAVVVRRNVVSTNHTEESGVNELKSYLELASQLPVFESNLGVSGKTMPPLEKPESGEAGSLLESPESAETVSSPENPESRDIIKEGSEMFVEKDLKSFGDLEDAVALDIIDTECGDGCDDNAGCDDDAGCVKDDGCEDIEASTETVDNKFISKAKHVEESTPKLAVLIPTKSDNRIRMKPKMLSLQPTVPRSPLCVVQNSHRILSNHRHNSVKSKSNHTNNMVLDKENVFH